MAEALSLTFDSPEHDTPKRRRAEFDSAVKAISQTIGSEPAGESVESTISMYLRTLETIQSELLDTQRQELKRLTRYHRIYRSFGRMPTIEPPVVQLDVLPFVDAPNINLGTGTGRHFGDIVFYAPNRASRIRTVFPSAGHIAAAPELEPATRAELQERVEQLQRRVDQLRDLVGNPIKRYLVLALTTGLACSASLLVDLHSSVQLIHPALAAPALLTSLLAVVLLKVASADAHVTRNS